jgi:hypothetical protein
MSNWKMGFVGAALSLCAAPLASAAEIIIHEPPPAVVEEGPPRARRGYVWTGNHYEWRHNRYVHVRGHWVRERHGYEWAPGRWERRDDRYHWHRGEWHPHR